MPYTKITDFAVKDSLPSGDNNKIIRGTEIDAELEAIEADSALKAPLASPTFTGTVTLPSGQTVVNANLTGNPTAPTATFGDADTTVANTAFVQNAVNALPANIPSVTGQTGKYLTNDGTNASWGTITQIGVGGTTITGNVTLTAASPAAMSVTPATPGLYVTLPDATTVSRSTTPFSVYNAGDYDYGVKDSAGTQLGWVRARTGAMIGLADNSTAAGIWSYYGLEKTGITASYVNSTLTNMGNTIRRIALDADRTCFLFGGTDCYAIVYDASTQTWGSATLVKATITSGCFHGVLSATNQILVAHALASGPTFTAVTLTISGTSVTVNTPVNVTPTFGVTSMLGQFIAAGSSFVLAYLNGAQASIRAFTVAGTVPALATNETTVYAGGVAPVIFASGSVVRTVSLTSATNIAATPYTVSGTGFSVGTAANATCTGSSALRAFLNGNGNIVCHYINTTHFATIFKLTGTVEAASTVSISSSPAALLNNSDYVQVTASKTAFVASDASFCYINILTDSSGTATAGTVQNFAAAVVNLSVAGLGAVGNTARFLTSPGSPTQMNAISFDCSGASPTSITSYQITGASGTNPSVVGSDAYGVRNFRLLILGSAASLLRVSQAQTFDMAITTNGFLAKMPLPLAARDGNWGVTGANSNESYAAISYNNGSTGYIIQRIEAAA